MEQLISELFKYLKILKKRSYLFFAVALVVTTGMIYYSYTLPNKYRADSTVFIETNVINNLVKGLAISPGMDERIKVLKYALLSRDIIRKTVLDLNPGLEDESKIQKTVASLQLRTDISTIGKSLFKVSFVDSSPVFAQSYINTLIGTYIHESLVEKRAETDDASQFLVEQIDQFRKKLEIAEDRIIAFRNSQGMVQAHDEITLLGGIDDYRRQTEEIDLAIANLINRRSQLKNNMQNSATSSVAASGHGDAEEVALQKRLQELQLTYTENYPEVIKVRAELDYLRQQRVAGPGRNLDGAAPMLNLRQQEIEQQLDNINTEIRSLQGKKTKINQFIQQRDNELRTLPEQQKKMSALIQERDSYQKIYEEMLLRLNQSEVSRQMELGDQTTTFRVVDSALLPTQPISPDMSKLILMAIVAGVGCGFGVVVLLENFDSSVKSVSQISHLGFDVIAMVPAIVDENKLSRKKKIDRLFYSVSGTYFSGVLGLLVFETLKRMGILS